MQWSILLGWTFEIVSHLNAKIYKIQYIQRILMKTQDVRWNQPYCLFSKTWIICAANYFEIVRNKIMYLYSVTIYLFIIQTYYKWNSLLLSLRCFSFATNWYNTKNMLNNAQEREDDEEGVILHPMLFKIFTIKYFPLNSKLLMLNICIQCPIF